MSTFGLLGSFFIVAILTASFFAIWLTNVLIKESHELKKEVKDVQCAFGNIEIEINKRLMLHNALHYAELLNIVKAVKLMVPDVDITLDREFQNKRVHILVESDKVRSKMTFVGTIVEYGTPKLSEPV